MLPKLGLSKEELVAALSKADLTPETVAEVISQNNKTISEEITDIVIEVLKEALR